MPKIVNMKLVAEYSPAPDPPEEQAEFRLDFSSYSVSENLPFSFTIIRDIRQDQVIDIDWAFINVSVVPLGGTARFEVGVTELVIEVNAQEVITNEEGSLEISNPRYVSGPVSNPILVTPYTAFVFVNDTTPTDVAFTGDLESGTINNCNNDTDGFIVDTLDEAILTPQSKITVKYGSPDLNVNAAYDSHVVQVETPPSNGNGSALPMMPRLGGHCFKILLDKNKDYTLMNNGTYDKPRNHLNLTSDWQYAATDPHRIPPDKEWWLGYSVYLPSNYEVDTSGRRIQLLQSHGDDSGVFWSHQIYAYPYGSGPGANKWYIVLSIIDDSIYDGGDTTNQYFDCGEIYDDLGLWTDWVFRIRWNPFDTPTNPSSTIAGAVNYDFPANTGIFQVWKTTGPVDANGNRAFIKVGPNIINGPAGLVPRADKRVYHSFRLYYPTWKYTLASNFTEPSNSNVVGPVAAYFDEIKLGGVEEHGTTFADVNPGRLQEPSSQPSLPPIEAPATNAELVFYSGFETGIFGHNDPENRVNGVLTDQWILQTMDANCPNPDNMHCLNNPLDATPYPGIDPNWDYSYVLQSVESSNDDLVGPVGPRSGTKFARFELRHGDTPLEGDSSPRSQVKTMTIADNETYIKHGVTNWVQFSLFHPSQRAEVFPNEDLTLYQHAWQPETVFSNAGISYIADQFEYVCADHAASKGWTEPGYIYNPRVLSGTTRSIVDHPNVGRSNPLPVFPDEWVDWRFELKPHPTNGVIKVWYRRPYIDNVWNNVVNITEDDNVAYGALRPDNGEGVDSKYSFSCYGGPHQYTHADFLAGVPGAINEAALFDPPILYYLDDWSVYRETSGPTLSASANTLLQELIAFNTSTPRKVGSGHQLGNFVTGHLSLQPGGDVYELQQTVGVTPWLFGVDYDSAAEGEVHDYSTINALIKDHVADGGAVTISIHARIPGNESLRWDDWDSIDIGQLITLGTNEYNGWRDMLDEYAVGLQDLMDSNVPVLFRPFHEMNRTKFWWTYQNSTMTSDRYKTLWQQTYDYLTITKGLNNLLWVWAPVGGAGVLASNWYPGSDYVHVIAASNYEGGTTTDEDRATFLAIRNIDSTKPFAFAEGFRKESLEEFYDNATFLSELENNYTYVSYFLQWKDQFAAVANPNPATLYTDPLIRNTIAPLTMPTGASEIFYTSYFETGAIQPVGSDPDGWQEQSMRSNCWPNAVPDIGAGCDLTHQTDYSYALQVLENDNGVTPRIGRYMCRMQTYKDDNPLAGDFNERSQLRIKSDTTAQQIAYNQTHWVDFSVYLPSAYTHINYSLMLFEIKFAPSGNYDTDVGIYLSIQEPTDPNTSIRDKFTLSANYWDGTVNEQGKFEHKSAGALSNEIGYSKPIDSYKDEWLDFRMELKINQTSGRIYLSMRRPESEANYTRVVAYDGPVGRTNGLGCINPKCYGGGFVNAPNTLVVYHDGIRVWK